jgi:uncharacterized repeat protein (TIGR02543 family)
VVQTGNTYKTSISGYVTSTLSSDKFFGTLDVTYTHPNNYFVIDYIVRSPTTLSATGQTVHMYLDHDAMILGCDASQGYTSTNGTGTFIGDYRPSTCTTCPGPGDLTSVGKFVSQSSHGFKAKNGFRSFYTGEFSSRTSVNSTLQLSNTYTTSITDDGIAVEFTAGPFTQANQTLVRSVAHCYGNEKTEFDNLVINVPAAPAVSTPVTVNFASAEFTETEGNHATQNVKITVSGGTLASGQVCSFTVSGGTAAENTHYTYVKGFTIPAGNYSTPQDIVITNVTIKDNSTCNDSRWMNITIDEPSECNDMLVRGRSYTAKIVIADDEPRPEITTSLSDTIYNTSEAVQSLALASDVADATITWTNSNPAIGLAASGTGNIPSFTATNTTASPITATISVKAAKECTGQTKTFTITVNPKFNITYDYNGGAAPQTANPTEFIIASLPLNITGEPARTGYTFTGWTCAALGITTPESPFTVPVGTAQNLALTANWNLNVYDITFNVPAGIANTNQDKTYTYEENITIADPAIPGFTFSGWTIANDEASSPAVSPVTNVSWTQHTVYGNLQFSVAAPTPDNPANWSPVSYSITYNYNGGTAPSTANPSTYTALTDTITLNAPTRNGYTFLGWTVTSSEQVVTFLPLTQTIPAGSYGNLTCAANWSENTYTIAYELNGAAHPQTPVAYSFTEQVAIADPVLAGYTFTGWTVTNSESTSPAITPTKNVSFGPGTVFGNLNFAVSAPPSTGGGNGNWNQITYNITYNLNGGSHGASHPNTYKVTDQISIDIPAKMGYTFAGWTVTSDSISSPLPTSGNPATTFGPSNGVYGNLTFTANWSTDAYTITYNAGASDASFTNNTNPGTYNIEDTPITLTSAGAKRNGYTFDGWTITVSTAGVAIPDGMTVPAGTFGNLVCTAKWTVNNYNITFNAPATVVNPNSNRTYTYEDGVTIANPTVPGYTFLGWTITNDSLSAPAISPVNSAWLQHTVYGNLTFAVTDPTTGTGPTTDSPNWDRITYSITYNLNGGTPPATDNPTQYDAQDAITLNAPSRTAYSFLGWTITSDSAAVTFTNPTATIPAGSYGNLTCTANWGINTYTVTYSVPAGVTHPLTPTGYTFTDTVAIADPTVTGWTFNGWTVGNDAAASPAITPAKGIAWTPGTIFGNLSLSVTDPSVDPGSNWTKTAYAVTYDLNEGTGAIPTDADSPYSWGTTVTILGKTNSMALTGATFIGWSDAPEALVTTQPQEDAITRRQAGETFTMPVGGKTLYAVWAKDLNGPTGGPDGTPDYKQVSVNYLPSSSVTASSGTYPSNVMFNTNTQGTVSGNTGNLAATKKVLDGWSLNNVPSIAAGGSIPENYYKFGDTISIAAATINLYAVWADDSNENGTADYKESTSGSGSSGGSSDGGSTGGSTGGGIRPPRSTTRSEQTGSTDVSGFTASRLRTGRLETPGISIRSAAEDDAWYGWNSDWDNVTATDVAFADLCDDAYMIKTDTFGYSRRLFQAATAAPFDYNSGFLYSNETFLPDSAVIVWHYEFDGKSEAELKDLLLNVNDQYNIDYDSPYSGSITDSVYINEVIHRTGYPLVHFSTRAYVMSLGWSDPYVDGWIISTDMVKSPYTGEARHYDRWPADSISSFIVYADSDLSDYIYPEDFNQKYANTYEIIFQFNKDLITKLTNGGSVRVWYEVIDGSLTGNTYSNLTKLYARSGIVFNHVYRRFELEDETADQYYSLYTNRLYPDITYGSPALKRSINGLNWRDNSSPLSTMEQIAIGDSVAVRLRDPGDICGRVIHFNTYPPATVQRPVRIHSMDGFLKTYPAADVEHFVEGQKDFTFVITFAGQALKVMAEGYYSGSKNEVIGDSIGVNTYQYTIYQVTEPMDIHVLPEPASGVSNDAVIYSPDRVWTYGNTLYIRGGEATEASVYSIGGTLQKQLKLNDDITREVMERGVYAVKLEGKHYKVIIR